MSVKGKWLPMNYIMNNLTGKQQIQALERKQRYYVEDRGERRMKDKLVLADLISEQLPMTDNQKIQLKYLIEHDFKDFNKLSRKCSKEKIIAILCFFIMKIDNPGCRLSKYKVFNENNISNDDVTHIFFRLATFYRRKTPINF